MSNLFEPSKRESAVDIVVNSIKQLLMDRRLKPGDRLPSELEISEGLDVSRGSVREAMKILSAFGLVDIRVGNGTYVCETPGNGILDSFLFSFFISNPNIENLYELRKIIEIDVLELILEHYEDNQKERLSLNRNLNELEDIINGGSPHKQLSENDLEFHRLMGKASQNLLLERIYNFIIDFMEPSIRTTHKNQNGDIVYKVHKSIMDTINSRNKSGIESAVESSVETWSIMQYAKPEER